MPKYPTRYKPKDRHHSSGRVYPDPPPQHLLDKWQPQLESAFVGVTTDGTAEQGLFPIRKTGVSTQPIKAAVEAFLQSLTGAQRTSACMPVDAVDWRAWSNYSVRLFRHGAWLDEMTQAQKDAAHGVLRSTLSAAGYETAVNVMRLNETIAEICNNWEAFGETLYWLTIFGTPSDSEPWGWQIDGHHLAINCFILGDQLVMTPCFMGSEPVVADSGKYEGTRVFDAEEAAGFALMQSLSPAQKASATIGLEIPFDTFASCFTDNYRQERKGVCHAGMDAAQRALLLRLIEIYVGRMRPDHAAVKMAEVREHLDDTWFAWIGGHGENDTYYYQVYSPVILIEFDHQPGLALQGDKPTRDHIHTVVRTPNGNDYGKDLLRQHYESAPHGHHHHHPHPKDRESGK